MPWTVVTATMANPEQCPFGKTLRQNVAATHSLVAPGRACQRRDLVSTSAAPRADLAWADLNRKGYVTAECKGLFDFTRAAAVPTALDLLMFPHLLRGTDYVVIVK